MRAPIFKSMLLLGLFFEIQGFAESMAPPCFRYSYQEKYKLEEGAPPELKIVTKVGTYEGAYLFNPSPKSLIVQIDEYHCIKLVDGNYYEGRSCALVAKENRPENSSVRRPAYTNPGYFAKNRTVKHLESFGSNNSPPSKPASFRFEIAANFEGRPIAIPVLGSYVLVEKTCK